MKKGRCDYISEWGRCHQKAERKRAGTQLCVFHIFWNSRFPETPDRGYHQKIVLGLLEPTWMYLSEQEIKATLSGRHHGDGRRLDHYVVDEPVEEW